MPRPSHLTLAYSCAVPSPVQRTTTPTLFLDFDGVLHPCTAGTFIYLDRIEAFLVAHPEVEVVLSTSWREDQSLESLQELFSPAVRAQIVDVTPVLSPRPCIRQREIELWLHQHNRSRHPWAALDDDASLFSCHCPQLVLCNTVQGLRPAQLTELSAVLGLKP